MRLLRSIVVGFFMAITLTAIVVMIASMIAMVSFLLGNYTVLFFVVIMFIIAAYFGEF